MSRGLGDVYKRQTHGGMIHLSRAKEPEVFRGFWLFFALVSI